MAWLSSPDIYNGNAVGGDWGYRWSYEGMLWMIENQEFGTIYHEFGHAIGIDEIYFYPAYLDGLAFPNSVMWTNVNRD